MGYTHYFSNPNDASPSQWRTFSAEVRALLAHPAIAPLVCEEFDTPDLPPVVDANEVRFNGKGNAGHETFYLTRRAQYGFCKTGGISEMTIVNAWGKHYDVAVCAVLIAARRHLGELVSSDGDWEDEGWMRARVLYARVTGYLPQCPWAEKQCAQCRRFFSKEGHNWGASDRGPQALCYLCASGYANVDEADAGLRSKMDALFRSLERVRPLKLVVSHQRPFEFVVNCVGATAEFVNYVRDSGRAEEITHAEMARHCNLKPFRHMLFVGRKLDWHVGYFRSRLPSGPVCFYFVHSGIEWFFVNPDEPWDLQREYRLARDAGY